MTSHVHLEQPRRPHALLRPDPSRLPHPPLVDVHVHLAADGGPGLPAEQWPQLAASAGVRTAVAFPPERTSYAGANAALLAWSREQGQRVVPFARLGGVVPWTVPEPWQLRRSLRSRVGARAPDLATNDDPLAGFAGIKLLPHLDGFPSEPLLDLIAERHLPVLVHGGRHVWPALIEQRLVQRLPGPIIVAHLGAFPDSAGHLRGALELARRHEHVYLDTSGAWLAEFLVEAVRRVPDKLLFGSDAPLVHPLVAWHHLASAVVDDRRCLQIAHETAREVFGW